MDKTKQAKTLLIEYFERLFEGNGVYFSTKDRIEVAAIVDLIIEAVAETYFVPNNEVEFISYLNDWHSNQDTEEWRR